VGTGLGGDGDDVVRWQERIYWQWHHALLDRAGEAGTVGEHDQHSIGGVRVELSQRGGDGGRLIGQFGVTHSVATVVTDVVLQRPVCHVAQVRPDGGDDERPAHCRRDSRCSWGRVKVGCELRVGHGVGFLGSFRGDVDVGAHRPLLHADHPGLARALSAQPVTVGSIREVARRVAEGVHLAESPGRSSCAAFPVLWEPARELVHWQEASTAARTMRCGWSELAGRRRRG
jgi:hypothetical protein